MLNIFKLLKKYQETLSKERIRYIAAGFVLGMFLGLLPLSVNSVIIALLVFALRNDRQTALLSTLIFGALGFALDRLAHPLGLAVLQASFLQGLWTYLYNLPFLPFTGFNNTIVMGNTLLGLILTAPAIFLCKILALKYRGSKLQAKIEQFLQNKLVSGIAAGFNIFNLRGLFIRKS
ncbi:MAG: TIGR03546 family protein [Candidatus Margulisbacteria bacterium]|nr:TIGR03546 family protein [Candidatus Margulisiibacteriota bacterium]